MASPDNLASLEPWAFGTSFRDSWISEAFARDTETLTRALQKSLSNESESITTDTTTNSSFVHFMMPEQTPAPTPTSTASGSDHETAPKRRNSCSATGKISKRKSRATKRSPTTFITADPANFRQMVQQVTGIRFCNSHMPVSAPVLKPEPQRPGNRLQSCLPTLDTSEFFLNHHQNQLVMGATAVAQPHVSFAPVVADGGVGFDFDTFQSFPTLESWKVM